MFEDARPPSSSTTMLLGLLTFGTLSSVHAQTAPLDIAQNGHISSVTIQARINRVSTQAESYHDNQKPLDLDIWNPAIKFINPTLLFS